MKNRLKLTLLITCLILVLGAVSAIIVGYASQKDVVFSQKYIAVGAQLKNGFNYKNVGCMNDSSRVIVRKDSILFWYNGEKISYKTLYNERGYRFYGIRQDGVVVNFTRWRISDKFEVLVLDQPEARFILNPVFACPEIYTNKSADQFGR